MKPILLKKYKQHFPSFLNDFDSFFDGFNDIFKYPSYLDRSGGSLLHNWSRKPLLNVSETNKEYRVELSVPGFSKENVKVELDDNTLTIIGFRKTKDSKEYSYSEFSSSSFERKLSIPNSVNSDDIVGNHEDGVLTLTIPKLEEVRIDTSREIKID